jgi:glycosyltransferase involved in cell wall biosynthesis
LDEEGRLSGKPHSEPEIDVIIPVFNGASYLEQAVRSAAAQTLRPARIIIADDGSQDETPSIARKLESEFAFVTHLRLPHGGVSAARNAGIAESSSPYIAFLDSDDVWLPSKLEAQMEVFAQADDRVGVVHSSYVHIDQNGDLLKDALVVPPKRRGDIFHQVLLEDYVVSGSASSVVVRRDVLDQVGRFDERLFHGEDWDMWIRLASVAHFDFTEEPVVQLRLHGNSSSRQNTERRALDFFLQYLIIFGKWDDVVASKPTFRSHLRRRALLLLLPSILKPLEVDAFYRELESQDSPLARSLFRSRSDLWLAMGGLLRRYGVWRLRRHLLNDRRRFLE